MAKVAAKAKDRPVKKKQTAGMEKKRRDLPRPGARCCG